FNTDTLTFQKLLILRLQESSLIVGTLTIGSRQLSMVVLWDTVLLRSTVQAIIQRDHRPAKESWTPFSGKSRNSYKSTIEKHWETVVRIKGGKEKEIKKVPGTGIRVRCVEVLIITRGRARVMDEAVDDPDVEENLVAVEARIVAPAEKEAGTVATAIKQEARNTAMEQLTTAS
ncbi:hypothetical protein Tco_1456180, partial [Tanacetum coccineum]